MTVGKRRITYPIRFGAAAKVTAAKVTAAKVTAAMIVGDTDRTYLLERSSRDQAIQMLAKAVADLLDLEADLRQVPPPIDLDALRRLRAGGDR